MKKLLSILFCILSLTTSTAGVPTEMKYQVMVIHGKGTPQDITIGIKLRKGNENGTEVWSKDFVLTDVRDKSVQTLTLDFGEGVNWNDDSDFYLATFIDGEEAGVSKVTSVPYAFVAQSLGGVVTKEFLVGTWTQEYEEYGSKGVYSYTFNEDGTGVYFSTGKYSRTKNFTYYMNSNGIMLMDDGNEKVYAQIPVIISKNKVALPYEPQGENKNYTIFTREEQRKL